MDLALRERGVMAEDDCLVHTRGDLTFGKGVDSLA